jgi:threonine dehydratase
MERQKLISEGAGAVGVAAVMFDKVNLQGKKAVCVVSGGNIDVNILSRVIKRGLLMSGRCVELLIELQDKPGQLNDVTRIIADLGGNVTTVHHERSNSGLDINGCYMRIELETRNHAHIEQIRQGLKDFGFKLIN